MSDFITLFVHYLPDLLQGMLVTLWLTIQGLAAGFVLGLLASLARV